MPEPLPYLMDQPFLMPVDLRDWLAKDDIVYFISDTIDLLNLSAIVGRAHKTEKRGRRSYHPHLMIKLIIYGFVAKVYSSRNLETATYRRLDFRVLTGDQHPDHATISTFRKKHLGALSNLFTEVLRLCVEARLVAFETLSVDGTKIQANASIRANRTEKSLEAERERELEFFRQHAQAYMDKADAADAEDDAKEREAAKSKIGQLSPELLERKSRREYIDRLLAAHRKEAAERDAGRESKASSDAQKPENSRTKNKGSEASEAGSASADGAEPKSGRAAKEIKVNTTDSDSRIMRDGATKAYVQAYNAQIVVDGESQIIVATAVTQDANDKKQLVPMAALAIENLGRAPEQLLADAGYYSESQVTDKSLEDIELLVPPDRACTTEPVAESSEPANPVANREDNGEPVRRGGFIMYLAPMTFADRMRAKLKTPAGRKAYGKRSSTVEPVFGQIKSASGFDRFLLRGKEQVGHEWSLVCMASNLKKLYRATAAKSGSSAAVTTPKVRQNNRNLREMTVRMAI